MEVGRYVGFGRQDWVGQGWALGWDGEQSHCFTLVAALGRKARND